MNTRPLRIGIRSPRWATQNDQMINGIVHFLREHQLSWIIDADIDTGNELPPNRIDASWSGDGLIVFRCDAREAAAWKQNGISVVNISSETRIDGIPNILPDNYQMGRLAADYLLSLGLRRFAYAGEKARRYSELRAAGFIDTLQHHGLECIEIDLEISSMLKSEKWTRLHHELTTALSELPHPVGVLARDDIVAMNVLRSARALGIKVPDDLALIGINDSRPYCLIAHPQLSSVKHPGELIGYHAAKALHALLNGNTVPPDQLIPSPGIVERESTNIIAIQDPLVSRALSHIRAYAKSGPINVKDLSRELGVSNTTLRSRFKQCIGHTPKEEIDSIRHQEIKNLLQETSLNIQEIAYQLGFATPEELSRFFARKEGVPPSQFKQNAHRHI
ncbi:substrate-binding domain-containing protein [Rubritalea tangerina]|uniref:Substrate-binding domain-containing protein n=1 Tax=Rubritalea tangerina TaxID=430798 RepID=A0ABW4ZED3_9BACT